MPEANRKKKVAAWIGVMLWGILYWAAIVLSALGITTVSLWAIICFAVCTVAFEEIVFGKVIQLKKRLLVILCAEAMLVVPWVLIFVIRELI